MNCRRCTYLGAYVLFWDGNRFIYYPIMSCFVFSFKKKIQRDVPEKYASNKGE